MSSVDRRVNFLRLIMDYEVGLEELRVLASHIGQVAAEYDKGIILSFAKSVSALFPGLPLNSPSNQDEASDTPTPESSLDSPRQPAVTVEPDKEKVVNEIARVLSTRAGLIAFGNMLFDVVKKAPAQGPLIRRGALVALTSHFEWLVAQLIHAFYERYPNALPATDRTLTLADLRQIGSVADAEAMITAKEIDAVLRESLSAQLDYFSGRLKIKLEQIAPHRASLIEIDQRRNLFVHNRGIVNRVYLTQVDPDLVATFNATEGKPLQVSMDYLINAIDVVDIVGTILIHVCWRKWEKAEVESADGALHHRIYTALQDRRHRYVKEMARFAQETQLRDEATRRTVCINHAIALRDEGETGQVETILGQFDWSAAALKYQLALCAVRDRREAFLELLPKALAAKEITIDDLEQWPLFRHWRGSEWFDAEVCSRRST